LSDIDLDTFRALRAALREELAPIVEGLTVIEEAIKLIPD
jgi:hypothetical protein